MTTPKNTTGGPDRECRRCNQESSDTRNKDFLAVPCQGAAYRVSLVSDTPVPTTEGWTTLGNIVPGDAVFDEEGRVCHVIAVSGEFAEPVSQVIFNDGSSVMVGRGHPWMILTPIDFSPACRNIRRPGPWNAGCWPLATRELAEYLNRPAEEGRTDPCHYIPVASALMLTDRKLPIDPWILGLWLGDGDSDGATIFSAPEDEPHYRNRIGETGELWRVLNPGEKVLRCSLSW